MANSAVVKAWSLERNHADNGVTVQLSAPVERLELDQKRSSHHVAAELAYQVDSRGDRPARCQKIVDHKHPLTLGDSVAMDLEGVGPVLQLVLSTQRLGRKLPELSN